MKPRSTSRPTAHVGQPSLPALAADAVRQAVNDQPATSRTLSRIPQRTPTYEGLIPPHEMFGRILPGRYTPNADLPFEKRVERAWAQLKTRFEEREHERLRETIVGWVTGEGLRGIPTAATCKLINNGETET